MVKINAVKYNPIMKSKGVNADVANTLGLEEAISYIHKYHNEGDTGEPRDYETPHGAVRVSSDEKTIHIRWAE